MQIPQNVSRIFDVKQKPVYTPIPEALNPFAGDNVDIWAVEPPDRNVKTLTVLGLLIDAFDRGKLDKVKRLVEATSGNTGLKLLKYAPLVGINKVRLVVPKDLAQGKRAPLDLHGSRFESADLIEGKSAIETARIMGGGGYSAQSKSWVPDNGDFCLDQYANPAGPCFIKQYLGKPIAEKFEDTLGVFSAGIGTGGSIIGINCALREAIEKIHTIGVLCAPGHEVPGVRELAKMKGIKLPWTDAIDRQEEVEQVVSYLAAWQLLRIAYIDAGPSAGFAYAGLLKGLAWLKKTGNLEKFRKKGVVTTAFLVPDDPRPYADRFMANLKRDWFENVNRAPMPWDLLFQKKAA